MSIYIIKLFIVNVVSLCITAKVIILIGCFYIFYIFGTSIISIYQNFELQKATLNVIILDLITSDFHNQMITKTEQTIRMA
jgi:hypothetical protein